MADFTVTSLPIQGPEDQPVKNRFFHPKALAINLPATLALLLPGLRYTNDMPLLYYARELLMQRNSDVLLLDSDMEQAASPADQATRLFKQAEAALHAGWRQGDYQKLVLVGKSIGTLAQAHLVLQELGRRAITIWLTPLLRQDFLVEAAQQAQGPALFITGSADPTFDENGLARIYNKIQAEMLLIEGANHSLEISGDPVQSANRLAEIVTTIAGFLDRRMVSNEGKA